MQHLLQTSLVTLALAIAVSPALAHDAPRSGAPSSSAATNGKPAAQGDEAKGQEKGPDTEDLFGFTIGTDVLEPGHLEVSSEGESSFGKRFGRYQAHALKNTFTIAPFEGFSIEFGAIANSFSIRNVPGLDNRSFTGFGGFSAEFKWQLLKRDPSPIGLTLLAEPSF